MNRSIFSYIISEISDQYLYDENTERPWIVGFSGGKDSTLLLQLVWKALEGILKEKRKREIYIVCNDTLVENPKIVVFVENVLHKIEQAATKQSMPIYVHRTTPRLEDSFWVNLIGRGYPAPNSSFRWCTERLKINPTTRLILDTVSNKGEVIILLGTRKDESASRAKSLKRHNIIGKRLRKHFLPNAYIYSPIQNVTNDELWQYLQQNSSPWGANNKELITLYKDAAGGDCPLVLDISTPACGQSRFGCWVCTLIKKDRSMEGLVDSGNEWLEPLIDIRDLLLKSRDKDSWRMNFRRNGQPGKGPYRAFARAYFLRRLLMAQKKIKKEFKDIDLITHQELVAIQINWYRDRIYNYKVSNEYNRIFKEDLDMRDHDEQFRIEEELLKNICKDNPGDFGLIQDLLSLQKNKSLMLRKRGLLNDIENRIESFLEKSKN